MRLTLIPAIMTAIVLAGCASQTSSTGSKKDEKKLTQTLQGVYTCAGKRHLGVAYEFVNDKATRAIVSSAGKTYELKRADQTDGEATAFTDGKVTWLASGQVTQQSINTHQGSRLLKVSGKGRNRVVAKDCNAS